MASKIKTTGQQALRAMAHAYSTITDPQGKDKMAAGAAYATLNKLFTRNGWQVTIKGGKIFCTPTQSAKNIDRGTLGDQEIDAISSYVLSEHEKYMISLATAQPDPYEYYH